MKNHLITVSFASAVALVACDFGMETPDYSQWDPKPQTPTKGGASTVNETPRACSCTCLDIQIQSIKNGSTLEPSKHGLGLNPPSACIPCPESQCRGSGGAGNVQAPLGGASAATGGASSVIVGGSTGDTSDPAQGGTTSVELPQGGTPAIGGTSSIFVGGNAGNTQDPPVGGKASTGGATGIGGGSTQDPPQGGMPATGGQSATGGTTSVGIGGSGNTQDPPVGGAAGIGGSTGKGGASATGGAATGGSPLTGGTTSVSVGGGSTQDPPTGGTTSTGGAATGGRTSTGGAATGGATTTSPPLPVKVKLWMRSTFESGPTYRQVCVGQKTGEEVTCSTTGTYCYVTLPDIRRESWSCHLLVEGSQVGTTYLPERDVDGVCANERNIVPFSGGDLIENTEWILEDWNQMCVFTFLRRDTGF